MYRFVRAAADFLKQKASAVVHSFLTIYVVMILIKLIYFNYETGLHKAAWMQLLTTLGSIFVLISFAFILKHKNARRYVIAIDAVFSFIIFSDLMFYRYFNDLISVPMLLQASVVTDVGSSVLELLHPLDLLFIADIVMLPFLQRYMEKVKLNLNNQGRRSGTKALSFGMSGLLMIYIGMSHLVASQPTILQTFYDRVYVAQNIGLLNYHAADAYRYVAQNLEEEDELSEHKNTEIMDFFSQKKKDNDKGLLWGAGQGKNIIVVQVEALQQFVINRKINGQEITPNLNKLIAESIYFDNYYYQTAGGGTSDAEFTANVSMLPMKEGAAYIRKPANYYYPIPKRLKDEGFETIAMHGYKPGFWNRSVVYKALGYDEFFSKNSITEDEILGMGISDKSFLKQALARLEQSKAPYYAFIITLSSHFPYDNDKSFYDSRLDVGEFKDTLLGDYLEAIHYTDEALGMFIEELEESGQLKNTVLAVYGDHHAISKDNMKELAELLGKEELNELEWQQLQKVPMLIHLPKGAEAQVVSTPGGGVDFMPTLLNIAGIDTSDMVYMGRDLLNSEEGFVVFRNGSFVTNDISYISNSNTAYDIKTGEVIVQEEYEVEKALAEKYLDYSDTIMEFDLIDDIKENLNKQKP